MAERSAFRKLKDFTDIHNQELLIKQFSDESELTLKFENFKKLMLSLFSGSNGKSPDIPCRLFEETFSTFDRNKDGKIDLNEFSDFCNRFVNLLVYPSSALIVIDVQNDFIDGSLAMKNCPAKQDGKDIIPVINVILEKHRFDVVVYTYDYHPKNHISFYENLNLYRLSEKNKLLNEIELFDSVIFEGPPEMEQKLWPAHCVQDSWGCELHKDLKVVKNCLSIFKGTNSSIDSYSAFFDNMKQSKTDLHRKLKERNVSHVFICGLALDYCVSCTAQDAIDLGYATTVIRDATRGTDDISIENTEDKLKSMDCVLAQSNDIENLLSGNDIRVEFALTLLKNIQQ